MQEDNIAKTCFVLMPFTVKAVDESRYPDSAHWLEVYEGLIVPAAQQVGLRCERDDEDTGSRLIGENILKKIEDATVILCDLSSHNPNVFLELGWAMRADKPFALMKDDLTTYTFDLNQQYTFDYSHSLQPRTLHKEVQSLAGVIRRTIEDSERRYSIVRRMSVSISAIKAMSESDLRGNLPVDIQGSKDLLKTIQMLGRFVTEDQFKDYETRLKKSEETLLDISARIYRLSQTSEDPELREKLEEQAKSLIDEFQKISQKK